METTTSFNSNITMILKTGRYFHYPYFAFEYDSHQNLLILHTKSDTCLHLENYCETHIDFIMNNNNWTPCSKCFTNKFYFPNQVEVEIEHLQSAINVIKREATIVTNSIKSIFDSNRYPDDGDSSFDYEYHLKNLNQRTPYHVHQHQNDEDISTLEKKIILSTRAKLTLEKLTNIQNQLDNYQDEYIPIHEKYSFLTNLQVMVEDLIFNWNKNL